MTLAQQLIGTWKLVSAVDLIDGNWIHRYGEQPKGYFTFGADNTISVQFMKFPVDDANKLKPFDSYLAYFGTYTVDEAASTFTSKVEGSLHPQHIDAPQTRSFRIEDNQLFIGNDSMGFKRIFSKILQTQF